jgi:hypothetical protein
MIDWLLFNANSNSISAIWQSYSLIDWLVVNANISSISAAYWREQFFFSVCLSPVHPPCHVLQINLVSIVFILSHNHTNQTTKMKIYYCHNDREFKSLLTNMQELLVWLPLYIFGVRVKTDFNCSFVSTQLSKK